MWKYIQDLFAAFLSWLEKNKDQIPKPPENPSAPVESPKLPIELGQTGPAVLKVQQRLKDLGYSLEVDGEFGEETRAAVIAFQGANQIGKTGRIGEQTNAALWSTEARGPVKPNDVMAKIAEIAAAEGKKNLKYNGVNSEAEKYLASVRSLIGMPSGRFAWCAAFVFWCCKQGGLDLSKELKGYAAYVPGWQDWAELNGEWHDTSEKSFTPQKGDIVCYDWDDDGLPDHIGIVLSYDGGSYIQAAEGNTSSVSDGNGDQTSIRSRHWDSLCGFIRVG